MKKSVNIVVALSLCLVLFLSGYTTGYIIGLKSTESDYSGQFFVSDLTYFYNKNHDILNKAAKEYILCNKNNEYIRVFCDEYNRIQIWDSTNKVDLTSTKGDYTYCIETISLMNDYMLERGFEKPQGDYYVGISLCDFGSDYVIDGDSCITVLFEFTSYDINVEEHFYLSSFSVATIDNTIYYRMYYSEKELYGFEKIADNWYIEVWHHM